VFDAMNSVSSPSGGSMNHGFCTPPSLLTNVKPEYLLIVMSLSSMLVTVTFHTTVVPFSTLHPGFHEFGS